MLTSRTHLSVDNQRIDAGTGPRACTHHRHAATPRSRHHLHVMRLRTALEPFNSISPSTSLIDIRRDGHEA